MKIIEKIINGADIRKLLFNNVEMYEMANILARDTGLPYNMWVDSAGKRRKTKHNVPRIKVEFSSGNQCGVLLTTPLSLDKKVKFPKGVSLREVFKFIDDHRDAFLIHFDNRWSDMALLNYLLLVGRRKKTKKEAIQYLLNNDIIDEIPKEFKNMFREN